VVSVYVPFTQSFKIYFSSAVRAQMGIFEQLATWDPQLFSYPYLEMVPETGDESSIIVREHYDASAFDEWLLTPDDLKEGSSILDVVSAKRQMAT
jgi:hypothetical protein